MSSDEGLNKNPGPPPAEGETIEMVAPYTEPERWIPAVVQRVAELKPGVWVVSASGNGGDGPHQSLMWGSRLFRRVSPVVSPSMPTRGGR